MRTHKHTPGPWSKKAGRVITTEHVTYSVDGPPSDFMFLENEADADLLAAAPDLLEALELCSAIMEANLRPGEDDMPTWHDVIKQTETAIAKARGK